MGARVTILTIMRFRNTGERVKFPFIQQDNVPDELVIITFSATASPRIAVLDPTP
jgi:hypothetical protein